MYQSSRGNLDSQSAKQAIASGMVPGGGLFVPTVIPSLAWQDLQELSYAEVAGKLMGLYLPDFTTASLERACGVYKKGTFAGANPAPVVDVGEFGVLELWHGPTAAFKDMALQVLPYLLSESIQSVNKGSEVLILVATSGDTGKAALEGFKNVEGTQIAVFYPRGGVSAVQERQMTTVDGQNTFVVGVDGNFDQCQTAVKEIFASVELKEKLARQNKVFSSANSINWGRLLPQIVYYFWAYLQAISKGKVSPGQPLNVVVPTGNFGNILAAYYAKQMGLPLGRLICASNQNNVLSDFLATGIYQAKREFRLTMSPSMDILISSNLERFLYEMNGRDSELINAWFARLTKEQEFTVDRQTLAASQAQLAGGWANEEETLATIRHVFRDYDYVLDPHTAVAVKVYEDYRRQTGDDRYTIVASTASPFKFASSVLTGLTGRDYNGDALDALRLLSQTTGWEIPRGLRDLDLLAEQSIWYSRPNEIAGLINRLFIPSRLSQ